MVAKMVQTLASNWQSNHWH